MASNRNSGGARVRRGSDFAMHWARNLRLGNPFANSILRAIAIYMNEDGTAWPGIATISADTCIAEDTVINRLRWLESIGAIALFKTWVDEHGRRNHEGRGRVTSHEIRFLFDADPEAIEAAAMAGTTKRNLSGAALASQQEKAASSPRPDGEQSPDLATDAIGCQNPVSPRLAPDSPPTPSARTLEPEPEDSPPNPPQAGGGVAAALYRIEDFKSAYPIPITNWSRFETQWLGMTDRERDDAITGAKGYASLCKKQPNRGVKDAHRWLKNREWIGFIEQGKTAETIAARIEAEEGSTQWRIWQAVLKIARGRDEFPSFWLVAGSNGKRAHLPKALPESLIALADPGRGWADVVEGDNGHFAAWLRWLHDILPANFIMLKTHDGKRRFSTPDPWPPRKDGSLGPPKDSENAA